MFPADSETGVLHLQTRNLEVLGSTPARRYIIENIFAGRHV